MKNFLVSYDLGLPETRKDYNTLISHLKTYEYWAKPLQSLWFIRSEKDRIQIIEEIQKRTDANDKILVIEVASNWVTYGLSADVNEWMKENL